MQHTAELTVHLDVLSAGHPEGDQMSELSLGRGVAVLIITSCSSVAGVIQDIGPHELSILVKHALPEGSAVTVEFGALTRKGEIVTCRRNGSRYEISVATPTTNERDLRTADRFPITQEVQICPAGSDSRLDAVIVDLSVHGIGLELTAALESGEIITVESVSGVAFGTVRHCRRLLNGRFRAGVEVFHVMPKEEATWRDQSTISTVGRLFFSDE